MRAVLTFRSGAAGWREEYHLEPGTPALRATARRLCAARSKVSATPTVIESYRIALVSDPRHPVAENLRMRCWWGIPIASPFFRRVTFAVADFDIAIVMKFVTANLNSRSVWISGVPQIPNKSTTDPQPGQFLGLYLKDVDLFRDALLSPLLRLVIREEVAPTDDTAAYVKSIDVDPLGRYRLHLNANLTLPPNALVRCNGGTGNNLGRLRGRRRVKVQPDAYTLVVDRGPTMDGGPLIYHGTDMMVRALSYQYSTATWQPSGEQTVDYEDYFFDVFPLLKTVYPTFVSYHLGSRHRGAIRPPRRGRRQKTKPLA
jgi:hypothetical protein